MVFCVSMVTWSCEDFMCTYFLYVHHRYIRKQSLTIPLVTLKDENEHVGIRRDEGFYCVCCTLVCSLDACVQQMCDIQIDVCRKNGTRKKIGVVQLLVL